MKNKRVLISAPVSFIDDIVDGLSDDYTFDFNELRTQEDVQNFKGAKNVVGWVVNPCPEFKINAQLLSKFPNLKVISTPSTGKSHIDLDDTETMGIKVLGLLDGEGVQSIKASSEFTFVLAMSALRKIPKAVQLVRQGCWRDREEELRAREICELQVAFIGGGRIGQNVSSYFKAIGSTTSVFDKYRPKTELRAKFDLVCDDIVTLVSNADVVICCVTSNKETKGLINSALIHEMKDGAALINTSRGEVLNEKDVVAAVTGGKLSQVAVDVIANENETNFLSGSELYKLSLVDDRVIITPHIAGLTTDSETKAQKLAINAAIDFLNE